MTKAGRPLRTHFAETMDCTRSRILQHGAGTSRREFLRMAAAAGAATSLGGKSTTAQGVKPAIKAVVFDAFAIFDARSVFRLAEELFPGRGAALSDQWRTRQFEYTWLRNSMHRYTDFWHVTQDALNYAAKQAGLTLHPEESRRLMAAYLDLRPWPDVAAVARSLQERGIRLAILSNMTAEMMQSCVKASGLDTAFEVQLSTDRVQVFKPSPAAYQMGLDALHLQKQEIAFVAFGGWDAVGARAFGYRTYWVDRLDLPEEELGFRADATHPDLMELVDFIHNG